jgi:hypothetical protein
MEEITTTKKKQNFQHPGNKSRLQRKVSIDKITTIEEQKIRQRNESILYEEQKIGPLNKSTAE